MNLYAESSAILTWLFDEPRAARVQESLAKAEVVISSVLALVECDRALHRIVKEGRVTETEAADKRAGLARAASHWTVLSLSQEIVDRARQPFFHEPVRTLDALHLSSALLGRSSMPDIALLSLDRRVRENAQTLGFELLPE